MRHLDDGILRRMVDEPFSIPDGQRSHYVSCSRCRERHDAIAADATATAAVFSTPSVAVDANSALARFRAQTVVRSHPQPGVLGRGATRGWNPALQWRQLSRSGGRSVGRPIMGLVAAVAVMASAVAWTPAGSLAQQFIQIFQPKQIVAISVTGGDLQTLRQLSAYGTFSGPRQVADRPVPTLADADHVAGFHVLSPATLPGEVTATPTYHVVPSATASFTFSAAKAAAAAQAAGKPAPSMPRNIDGSSIVVTTGNAVSTMYGDPKAGIPQLVIGEMRAPVVRSSGVSLAQLESYLLAQPGLSPQLAAQIKAINDPASTLPIPILMDRETSQHVTVQGVQGLAIGDSTGIGSGIVWQKDGMIYGVAGPESMQRVVEIANSLR